MDGLSELAKMFKSRENKNYMGPIIGEIISPLPNIKIKLRNEIFLEKHNCVIANHIYIHYKNIDNTYLLNGDKVILIPSGDEQLYFLVDKVVSV